MGSGSLDGDLGRDPAGVREHFKHVGARNRGHESVDHRGAERDDRGGALDAATAVPSIFEFRKVRSLLDSIRLEQSGYRLLWATSPPFSSSETAFSSI